MSDSIKKFIKKGFYFAIFIFFIRLTIVPKYFDSLTVLSQYSFLSCICESISISMFLMLLYERTLWRLNPFEHTPKIAGEYDGCINYQYNGGGSKNITLRITQTLLCTKINISTNEINSRSINSLLFDDNGEIVLFYNYITNPSNQYSKNNPINFGSCRISFLKPSEPSGIYWTNHPTKGDVILTKKI
jgi:hypothetical protein